MIKNYPDKYINTIVVTAPGNITVSIGLKSNAFLSAKFLRPIVLLNIFFFLLIYIDKSFKENAALIFGLINTLAIAHFFYKKINREVFKLYPYHHTAEIEKLVRWPAHYELCYESRYDESNRLIEVLLLARSAKDNKEIRIFSFLNKKSFQEFLDAYNQHFPDCRINE